MPICQLKTNYPMDAAAREALLLDTATTAAELLNKPLAAVMAMLDSCDMRMNGTADTVFFAEFRYVLPPEFSKEKQAFLDRFADRMLALFRQHTGVDPHRIYMQFTEMARESAWKYTGKD